MPSISYVCFFVEEEEQSVGEGRELRGVKAIFIMNFLKFLSLFWLKFLA